MERVQAKVMKSDDITIENFDIWLNETNASSIKYWDGFFDIEHSSPELISGDFNIVLADGRSGDIFIKSISTGINREIGASFVGTSPLK